MRKIHHILLRKCPNNRPMRNPPENPRRVFDRLASAQLGIGRTEKKHIPTELAHPDLKTHPGPGRRLRENHGPRLASQWLVLRRRFGAPFLFQGRRQAEDFLHLTGGELFQREQVFHG